MLSSVLEAVRLPPVSPVMREILCSLTHHYHNIVTPANYLRLSLTGVHVTYVQTNLIQYFTAVTFTVKSEVFHDKCVLA